MSDDIARLRSEDIRTSLLDARPMRLLQAGAERLHYDPWIVRVSGSVTTGPPDLITLGADTIPMPPVVMLAGVQTYALRRDIAHPL
jgi:hypothetical protein